MRFADPKNDMAFKKIFGDETKKEILISFLNSVLDFKDDQAIAQVSLANPYQAPKIPELNQTIQIAKNLLDILDDETIFLKTGLSIDHIKKLRV